MRPRKGPAEACRFGPQFLFLSSHEFRETSPGVEDAAGVWDYLFCLGIDVLRDPVGGAGGAAVPVGGATVFDFGSAAVWMDGDAWGAGACGAGMGPAAGGGGVGGCC